MAYVWLMAKRADGLKSVRASKCPFFGITHIRGNDGTLDYKYRQRSLTIAPTVHCFSHFLTVPVKPIPND